MTKSEALTAAWVHTECAAQLSDVAAIRQHLDEIRKALRALDRPLIKTGKTPGNEKPAGTPR